MADAAIAGLGMTELGKVYGRSPRRLAADAVRLAAQDAGLALDDLDGLIVSPGMSGSPGIEVAGALGLRDLRLLTQMSSFGATAGAMVSYAAAMIGCGAASAVACVFADAPLKPRESSGSAYGRDAAEWYGIGGLNAALGFRSVNAFYALAARRHMARYGTTSEQLGAVAVSTRRWAERNPLAQMRDPITLEDHQRSRWVVEPLHLLDCCLVSNGGIAVILTSAERARDLPRPPVHVWGWGQGHPGHRMARDSEFGLTTGAATSGPAAAKMAGITMDEVTACQIYDCYTFTTLVSLEDYGFCAKGEGGAFAASGALAPGGSLPTNTGGGQLSAYYMWGMTPLSEAVIQARGQGAGRQVPHNDVILVSGNGGILDHHSTLIVSPHVRDRLARTSPHARPTVRTAGTPETGEAGQARSLTGTRRVSSDAPTAGFEAPDPVRTADGASSPADAGIGVIRRDGRTDGFFDGAAEERLMVRRCAECGEWLAPDAGSCAGCGSDDLAWAEASGDAVLVSWAVAHSRTRAPAPLALIELAEGPWMYARLDDVAEPRAGLALYAAFVHPDEGESHPVFKERR